MRGSLDVAPKSEAAIKIWTATIKCKDNKRKQCEYKGRKLSENKVTS